MNSELQDGFSVYWKLRQEYLQRRNRVFKFSPDVLKLLSADAEKNSKAAGTDVSYIGDLDMTRIEARRNNRQGSTTTPTTERPKQPKTLGNTANLNDWSERASDYVVVLITQRSDVGLAPN
jgi:hypothetical protein